MAKVYLRTLVDLPELSMDELFSQLLDGVRSVMFRSAKLDKEDIQALFAVMDEFKLRTKDKVKNLN